MRPHTPVEGRHRNGALAAARKARSVELRTAGWTYQAIADELGYTSRATVYAIVHKALNAHEVEQVESLRALETARLDQLQAALWTAAMAGDVAAATQVRRIIPARSRLLGLFERVTRVDKSCRTVVCSCAPGTGHRSASTAAH